MKCQCMKILAAIFSRLLFGIHGSILALLAVYFQEDNSYYILLSGVLLLFVEMIVTLKMTKHGEWKWFSPMVFLYLCTTIPSFFVLELIHLELRMNFTNLTGPDCTPNVVNEYSTELQCMEEVTILILILGRWLMPRGKMSRDQLAQLLLIYLALGADILDILELMKEPSVKTNKTITVVGLCLFSWAVMQFTLVLTQSVSSTSVEREENNQSCSKVKNCIRYCVATEVASLISPVVMQDGPFLIYRLYLVTRQGVFNDSMTFFICKNILAVIIQVYRLVVFLYEENKKKKKLKQSHINLE